MRPAVPAVPLLRIYCDKSIYLGALPFRSSILDWDRRTSFAWASAGLFLFPFQTTRSENNRCNREAGRACKELRGSRRTLRRGKRANSTMSLLQNIPGESNRKNSSPRFARSIDAACCRAGGIWAVRQLGIFPPPRISIL